MKWFIGIGYIRKYQGVEAIRPLDVFWWTFKIKVARWYFYNSLFLFLCYMAKSQHILLWAFLWYNKCNRNQKNVTLYYFNFTRILLHIDQISNSCGFSNCFVMWWSKYQIQVVSFDILQYFLCIYAETS